MPVFLPGESQEPRYLAGCLWGHKELDITEQLTHTHRNKTKTNFQVANSLQEAWPDYKVGTDTPKVPPFTLQL